MRERTREWSQLRRRAIPDWKHVEALEERLMLTVELVPFEGGNNLSGITGGLSENFVSTDDEGNDYVTPNGFTPEDADTLMPG